MSWVMLDDNFPTHPKTTQAGPVAAYLYVCGLCYCRRYHTDGFIPARVIPTLGVSTNPKRMVQALVDAGLWDEVDNGYQVHDYAEFYADAYDKEKKIERRANGRKGGIEAQRLNKSLDKPVGGGTGVGNSSLEERTLESDFAAFWECYPKSDGKQAAFAAWKKLQPTDDDQRAMAADLERRKRSPQWTKDGGQFIPHASTYLNQKRWQDGFKEPPKPQSAGSAVLETLLGGGHERIA